MALAHRHLIKQSGGENKDGPTYTLVYDIATTTDADGPGMVQTYSGWSYGDLYVIGNDSDPRARVISIATDQLGTNRRHWTVTVEFGDPGEEDQENPLNDPPDVSWDYEDRQQAIDRDFNGVWLRNSAGDPFEEIVYVDDFRRKLTITRKEASFPIAVADALGNRLNAATWQGYPAKQVKLQPITAQKAYHTNIGAYWVVKYDFTFAPIAADWKRYIRDTGIHEIDLITGYKRRIILDDDSLAAVRVDLDGTGVRLPNGDTPIYKEFEVLGTADFSLLNLDSIPLT